MNKETFFCGAGEEFRHGPSKFNRDTVRNSDFHITDSQHRCGGLGGYAFAKETSPSDPSFDHSWPLYAGYRLFKRFS